MQSPLKQLASRHLLRHKEVNRVLCDNLRGGTGWETGGRLGWGT